MASRPVRGRLLLVFLAGVSLAAAGCKREKAPAGEPPHSHRSRPVVPGFALKDLDGKTVSLGQFKGKPVFLEFWATWCGPCRMSMPIVEELHRDYGPKGLQVLGLNMDEDPAVVAPFLREMGVGYPVLLAGGSPVADQYQVSGIPAFFLIDKDGRLADAWVGFDPGFGDAWRKAADDLLAP